MTVNKKKGDHFSTFSSRFRKIILQSDAELPRQAENDKVEQFRHLNVKINNLFSPAGSASQVLFSKMET